MVKKGVSLIIPFVTTLLVVVFYRYLYGYIYHAVDDVTINYSILNKEYTQEAANTDNTKTEKSKK